MSSSMSWEDAQLHLRKIREEQRRASEEVIDIWEEYLCDFSYKLGDDLWIVYEQVCIAACDTGRIDVAMKCIAALKVQFPGSLRVKRLDGLCWETQQSYENATEIYEAILEADPTNALVRKRKIAILKEQDKIVPAIEELNKYLKEYMGDYEAWLELSELYLTELDYGRAAFCMEELITTNPYNHLYTLKYAEIKYTHGGYENLVLARKYFAQTLKLNSNNLRAMLGLFLAASNIASSKKGDAKVKADNIKYSAWAADQIARKYSMNPGSTPDSGSSHTKAIETMLTDLQITQSG